MTQLAPHQQRVVTAAGEQVLRLRPDEVQVRFHSLGLVRRHRRHESRRRQLIQAQSPARRAPGRRRTRVHRRSLRAILAAILRDFDDVKPLQ